MATAPFESMLLPSQRWVLEKFTMVLCLTLLSISGKSQIKSRWLGSLWDLKFLQKVLTKKQVLNNFSYLDCYENEFKISVCHSWFCDIAECPLFSTGTYSITWAFSFRGWYLPCLFSGSSWNSIIVDFQLFMLKSYVCLNMMMIIYV